MLLVVLISGTSTTGLYAQCDGGGLTGARHDSPDKDLVQLSIYNTLRGTSTQYPRIFELQLGILPGDWFVPGAFDHVDERLMTAVPLAAAEEQQLQSYQTAAAGAAAVMAAKEDAILNGNSSEAQLQALLSEFSAAADDYAAANAQINTLLAPWRSSLDSEISGASAANAALGNTETWESREKALNALWLGKVRNGKWLTGADLAYIRETAEMCPWEGGFGVYKARALWQRISDAPLTPSDCTGTYREGPRQTSDTGFRLYPNPAQDRAILELPAAWTNDGAVQYRLFNALSAPALNGTAPKGAERRRNGNTTAGRPFRRPVLLPGTASRPGTRHGKTLRNKKLIRSTYSPRTRSARGILYVLI